jgi:hypothetical protein
MAGLFLGSRRGVIGTKLNSEAIVFFPSVLFPFFPAVFDESTKERKHERSP